MRQKPRWELLSNHLDWYCIQTPCKHMGKFIEYENSFRKRSCIKRVIRIYKWKVIFLPNYCDIFINESKKSLIDLSLQFISIPQKGSMMFHMEEWRVSCRFMAILAKSSSVLKCCEGQNNERPPASVISGIPQGNVLDLLLFVAYINDLPDI